MSVAEVQGPTLKRIPSRAIQERPLNMTNIKACGSTQVSPLKQLKGERSGSLDMARIVTKESTVLFKDIYENIQSTLKKYDGIVKENEEHKQRNDSIRMSGYKSPSNSIRRCIFVFPKISAPSRKGTNLLADLDSPRKPDPTTLEDALKTLKEQQQLLVLMLQNNNVQESIYVNLNEQTSKYIEQKTNMIESLKNQSPIRSASGKLLNLTHVPHAQSETNILVVTQRDTPPDPTIIQSKDQPSLIQLRDEADLQCQVMNYDKTPKITKKRAQDSIATQKSQKVNASKLFQTTPVEIDLKKTIHKRQLSKTYQKIDLSNNTLSPQSNLLSNQFFQDEIPRLSDVDTVKTSSINSFGYAAIHSRKYPKQQTRQNYSSSRPLEKVVSNKRIPAQQQPRQVRHVKSPSLNADSTQYHTKYIRSDFNKDLREIVGILDEFQEFKQLIEKMPKRR